jgi:hypothetical protein
LQAQAGNPTGLMWQSSFPWQGFYKGTYPFESITEKIAEKNAKFNIVKKKHV